MKIRAITSNYYQTKNKNNTNFGKLIVHENVPAEINKALNESSGIKTLTKLFKNMKFDLKAFMRDSDGTLQIHYSKPNIKTSNPLCMYIVKNPFDDKSTPLSDYEISNTACKIVTMNEYDAEELFKRFLDYISANN